MAFIMAIIGALVTASIWWMRLKYMRHAATDVIDLAGRARGKYKRKKFRQAAQSSPITTIDDPVIAAATLICEVATTDIPAIGKPEQEVVFQQICQITDQKAAREAVIYGAWAVQTVSDASLVILRLGGLLREQLNTQEKQQLIAMITAARRDMTAQIPIEFDDASFEHNLRRLKKRLGLEVER